MLQRLGFEVRPLSIGALVLGGWRHLLERRNVVIFHWPELRPFRFGAGAVRFRLRGWVEWGAFAMIAALARAPSIYFVHDHAVHDTSGIQRKVSEWLIGCFGRLCDRRVVHAPVYAERYGATYLPHPLYWNRAGAVQCDVVRTARAIDAGSPACSILGAIRPYKGIEGILEHWPAHLRLDIAGYGQPEYVASLRAIVERRGLQAVVGIDARFLANAELSERLDATDILILPHRPGTMLVSGAFFEAAGRVPLVVARRSPFVDWVSATMRGVHAFDDDAEIGPTILRALNRRSSDDAGADRHAAVAAFGWQACVDAYSSFLEIAPEA
ncbi:MAG: hypothetical protein WCK28_02090 [Burkholderiales bacterium]